MGERGASRTENKSGAAAEHRQKHKQKPTTSTSGTKPGEEKGQCGVPKHDDNSGREQAEGARHNAQRRLPRGETVSSICGPRAAIGKGAPWNLNGVGDNRAAGAGGAAQQWWAGACRPARGRTKSPVCVRAPAAGGLEARCTADRPAETAIENRSTLTHREREREQEQGAARERAKEREPRQSSPQP